MTDEKDQQENLSLEELQKKNLELLNNWKKTAADFENFKRRNEENKKEILEFAKELTVSKLMPSLQNLEQVLKYAPSDETYKDWVTGLKATIMQLEKDMEELGLKKIKTVGEQFDPTMHEAIEEVEGAEGQIMAGKAFPSYVAFTKDGQLLVGEPARRQAVTNPEGTAFEFKRKMGTNFKYKLGGPAASGGGAKEYAPEQLSAFLLQKIKKDAEAYLGAPVAKAVITVPAYFDDSQRQATKNAGEIAGLEVVRVINEPTAAAFAYGLDKTGKDQKILVFDLGGGTLDVTIMDFGEHEGQATFEVLSTYGDTQLGGKDMDQSLIDYVASEFKRETGLDLNNDKMAMNRVREAVEKAKIELSTVLESDLNLPFISADAGGPKHLNLKLTRAKLEDLVKPILLRLKHPVQQALTDAKLTPTDIGKIIMVGGPTRTPAVQKFVEEYIGKQVERGIDPMEAVAKGAAVQAGVLSGDVQGKEILLLDVTPLTLGLETLGGVATPLIERNTTIPTSKSQG